MFKAIVLVIGLVFVCSLLESWGTQSINKRIAKIEQIEQSLK